MEIAPTAFANILKDTPVCPVGSHLLFPLILLQDILTGTACRFFLIKIAAPGIARLHILCVAGAVALFRFTNSWLAAIVSIVFQAPLAFHEAVGIEHSRLFKEFLIRLRMEEDLTSAWELQMGMLPADALLRKWRRKWLPL